MSSVSACHPALHYPKKSNGSVRVGEGNGTPLQYSCLENPMDGGAWWAAVHGVAKSRTRLSDFTFTFHFSLWCIGEGNGNPLQCSCLENPKDRGAWWTAVYGVAQSRTQLKRLSSSVLNPGWRPWWKVLASNDFSKTYPTLHSPRCPILLPFIALSALMVNGVFPNLNIR